MSWGPRSQLTPQTSPHPPQPRLLASGKGQLTHFRFHSLSVELGSLDGKTSFQELSGTEDTDTVQLIISVVASTQSHWTVTVPFNPDES